MPELVALDIPGGPGFVDAVLRVWEAGDAVCVPDSRLSRLAARAQLEAMRPHWVMGPDGDRQRIDPSAPPIEAGDAAVIATSGTTGRPKAAVLTHQAFDASARASNSLLGVDPSSDRWLACIPLCHVGGFGVVARALLTGTPLEVQPRFDPEAVEAAGRRGANLVSLVPTALRRINPDPFRVILLGASAAPPTLPHNAVTTYGMTESCGGVFYDGVALEGVEACIGNGTTGAFGEILLRSPTLLRCYRDGTDPRISGGWFPTGDGGCIDTEGRIAVSGRLSEVINSGGEKVWPAAVEKVLLQVDAVQEVAVVGAPDPEWGETVVVFLQMNEGADPPALDEVRDVVRSSIAPWAAPRRMHVLSTLPKLPSGKTDRLTLKKLASSSLPPNASMRHQ